MNRRVLVAVTVLFFVAALGLAVAPAQAALHYKADTVTSGAQDSSTTVEAWVDGENAKVLFLDSDQPMLVEERVPADHRTVARPSTWSTPRTRPT